MEHGETGIAFDEATRTWLITTPATGYALRADDDGVRHVYWGPRLTLAQVAALPVRHRRWLDVLGDELPAEGGDRYGPASLRVRFADGARSVEWRHDGYAIDDRAGHLTVRLADRHYPLLLELHYRAYPDSDVIERWTVLRHTGDAGEPVVVERCDSASWPVPARAGYRISHVVGEWAAEFALQRGPLPRGETTLTARHGASRHQQNPWLMIDPGDATEEHGEVWSTVLAWGGSWRITARRDLGDHVTVRGGAGHEGVGRRLLPGEAWTLPVYAGLYATDGFGGTSRRWHDHIRTHVLPLATGSALMRADPAAADRPVLYNSWEGTWFDVDEAGQIETARLAADLGVELYVVDDGWFGRRLADDAGLGDWWPNPERFPDGLGPLIAEVHRLGMRFGLWVEPEMVNPDSDLYRAHPDWVLHEPNRRRTEVRNQLVLNLARPDVAEWTHGWLDRLLTEHAIDFLKWDMNRPFAEAGWPGHPDPDRVYFDHTANVYAIIDRLRADHPGLRIEACGSGGGRADLGMLSRTDQAWVSDNTDPVDRIAIQHGYCQVYPAVTMGSWASESPNPLHGRATPLRFRFHVAMAGALGVSGNLREWSAAERSEARSLVGEYKRIRHVVQRGRLYRLTPAGPDGVTAVEYVSRDRSEVVVLAWRPLVRHGYPEPAVRLAGLDPDATYRDEAGTVHHAAVLAGYGLDLGLLAGDHASVLRYLRR